ncbi:hormogonium polysaccharide biosynthesis protein HpsL [Calothrix sp. UHCC 0171]|uniref:hormogonium polysaccharide biosynthesis protein HpsL n=1 Tax=Calothrix sp. UHCC 0171 TaxID=3110245 RepID=UPI002B20808A|nr:hormogonium polysaccharide biosynthesis protein HpsL [Calothrix sp. UHCC 0171]MEA5572962.1 hormogonium polysaccharide biosynthesis protein HpsL [Calothrix sp. UHCC 0171]
MAKSKSKSQKSAKTPKTEKSTLDLKERLIQKRKAAQAKKELTSILSTAVGGGLFLGLILFLVGGIKAAVPGVLAVIILSLSYKYPNYALIAFIIYVPIGGTITYYIGNSPILQLAKDAFYIPALIGLWQNLKKRRLPLIIPKGITTPLFILLGICILTLLFVNGSQQFNPTPASPFKPVPKEFPLGMGILGLKVFLGYVPLIGCFYHIIRNKTDFLRITRLQIVMIIICCILGIIQYALLLVGICEGTKDAEGAALFKATLEARCYFGGSLVYSPSQGMIRLPGTFVAPWQWAWFLISSTFFSFATGFSDPSLLWRIAGLSSMAVVFINAVVSGQRIALALVPTCFILCLLLTGQLANLKRFIPVFGGLVMILGIAIASNPTVIQERTESFVSRWEASPPYEFITSQFEEVWKNLDGPLGNGLGRATNSARAFGNTKLLETYYPKVMHEVGLFGVLGFLALVTTLTIICFRTYRSIKNRNFRSYGAAMWVFILFISYNTYYYPLDVDPVAVYYWFAAGILLKLPEIDRLERLQEEQVERVQGQKSKQKK